MKRETESEGWRYDGITERERETEEGKRRGRGGKGMKGDGNGRDCSRLARLP